MLYQVTISFRFDDEFMSLVPAHRTYINYLINKNIIEHYAVSMEVQKSWITMHAESKEAVAQLLEQSPLHKFWTYEIAELFVMDGYGYRLPSVQLN
jgi:hypothetical protein